MLNSRSILKNNRNALTDKGLPKYVKKLDAGNYDGCIKDYKIIHTSNGSKLSFNISFTAHGSESIILPKMFDFSNSVIVGTPLFSFLNDFNVIKKDRRIDWDSLQDLSVLVEIKISQAGNPYINAVIPNLDEDTINEDEDDEDEDDDYEE